MNNEPEPKVRKKRYDINFKRSAVEHWLGSGKSAGQVAGELGISGAVDFTSRNDRTYQGPYARVGVTMTF